MQTPEQIIRAQRDEIETLREENLQLREALTPRILLPRSWGLKRLEECLLSALHAAGPNGLHEERVRLAVYGYRDEPLSRSALHVLVCQLRRKLADARTGITIETFRHLGWRLTPESSVLLDAAIEADRAKWSAMRRAA